MIHPYIGMHGARPDGSTPGIVAHIDPGTPTTSPTVYVLLDEPTDRWTHVAIGMFDFTPTDPAEARRRLSAAQPDPIEVAKAQGTAFAAELLREGRLSAAFRMALSSVVGDALDRVAAKRGEAVVMLAEAVGRGMRGGGA